MNNAQSALANSLAGYIAHEQFNEYTNSLATVLNTNIQESKRELDQTLACDVIMLDRRYSNQLESMKTGLTSFISTRNDPSRNTSLAEAVLKHATIGKEPTPHEVVLSQQATFVPSDHTPQPPRKAKPNTRVVGMNSALSSSPNAPSKLLHRAETIAGIETMNLHAATDTSNTVATATCYIPAAATTTSTPSTTPSVAVTTTTTSATLSGCISIPRTKRTTSGSHATPSRSTSPIDGKRGSATAYGYGNGHWDGQWPDIRMYGW